MMGRDGERKKQKEEIKKGGTREGRILSTRERESEGKRRRERE